MRVVLDTNVIISGVFWSGPPYRILSYARAKRFQAVISEQLLFELNDVASRAKFAGRVAILPTPDIRPIGAGVRDVFEVIPTPPLVRVIDDDPDDDAVVACAIAAGADYIISGDRHLLSMGEFQGIKICTAEQFIASVMPSLLE